MPTPENPVHVDGDELQLEATRVELPPNADAHDGAAPGPDFDVGAPDAPPPAAWAEITPGIVAGVDLFVCPAWELTDAEKGALSDALAPALDQLFPGGIGDERWAPYFRVLIVAGGIAAMRYDRDTGKLKPLRLKKTDAPTGEGAPIAAPGAGFSTGSGGGSY